MSLPVVLKEKLRLPVVGAPLFIVSNPDLVIAQCKSGIGLASTNHVLWPKKTQTVPSIKYSEYCYL